MKTNPTLPPPEEWDFRPTDPLLLSEAIVYEYSRTCDRTRTQICAWLDTKLKRKKIREHIRDAILATEKNDGDPHDFYPAGIWKEVYLSGLKATDSPILHVIMEARPDFPRPWTRANLRGERNTKFSRVSCYPLEWTFQRILADADEADGLKRALEIESRVAAGRAYELNIDFYADGALSTIQEIVADFEKWLRVEVKRSNLKTRTAKDAQVQQKAYPLKCLAALRLRRAGFTYEAAANALQRLAATKEDAWFLPMFENAPSWTKAVLFAEKTLAKFDAGKVNF